MESVEAEIIDNIRASRYAYQAEIYFFRNIAGIAFHTLRAFFGRHCSSHYVLSSISIEKYRERCRGVCHVSL